MKKTISTRDIWRHLKNKSPIEELIENSPVEYHEWIYEKYNMFQEMYKITFARCQINYINNIEPVEGLTKKEVHKKIFSQKKEVQKIFLCLYEKKDISDLVWKKIYPPCEKMKSNIN
jgi:hypothetical protein